MMEMVCASACVTSMMCITLEKSQRMVVVSTNMFIGIVVAWPVAAMDFRIRLVAQFSRSL